MANTIKIKQSSVSAKVPTAAQLSQGELAVNTVDEKLYSKNSSGAVFEVGTTGTAADILTKIKTVDGSTSGLDADLLDGVQGSGYGRFYNNAVLTTSTTTATFIAELIADYGCFSNNQVTLKVQWNYANSSDLVTGHATIGTVELAGCTIETWGETYKHVRISRPNTGTGGHMVIEYNDQGSGYSPAWREIWTSESDGTGSGLDADLLDGQHGSYYYPTSNPSGYISSYTDTNTWRGISDSISTTNSAISASQTAVKAAYDRSWPNTTYSVGDGGLTQKNFTTADNTKLDGIATSANNYSLPASVVHDTESGALHSTDALRISGHTISLYKGDGTSESVVVPDNNTDTNTWRGIDDTPVNGQTAESISSNWAFDHAGSSTAHPRDTRNQVAGTYNNYSHPTGAGNNHVPSGGSAGQFLKYSSSGVATWATPSYTTNTDTNTTYSAGTNMSLSGTTFSSTDTNTWRGISDSVSTTNAAISASQTAVKAAYDRSWPNTTYTATQMRDAVKTVDGAGSGLDADLLDGQQGSYYQPAGSYLTSETNSFIGDGGSGTTHPGTNRGVYSGQLSQGSAPVGMPTTDNSNSILTFNRHSGEYNSQIGFSSNSNMYYRSFSNTAINSTNTWRKVWDSGNDGSGSGLDADLLDGQQGSYYATTAAPVAPVISATSVVAETIQVTFAQSSTSGVDHYEVWSDGATGSDYSMIARIPEADIAASMSVIDSSFDSGGTVAYRVYAIQNGVYSTASTATRAFTVSTTLDVSSLSVIGDTNVYHVNYDKPDSRFLDHVEIYKDVEVSQASLSRTGAALVYSGSNSAFTYNIGASDLDSYHQFWVEVVTV